AQTTARPHLGANQRDGDPGAERQREPAEPEANTERQAAAEIHDATGGGGLAGSGIRGGHHVGERGAAIAECEVERREVGVARDHRPHVDLHACSRPAVATERLSRLPATAGRSGCSACEPSGLSRYLSSSAL